MKNKITVQPSGHQFMVEEGESILDAALKAGLAFPYGCRNGGCGVCKGKVVSGEVSYPKGTPACLGALEQAIGQEALCQGLAASDLVIEVHEVGAPRDVPVRAYPVKVAKLERLSEQVMRVLLKLPDTDRMQFLAGQYIDVVLEGDRRRSFSIANAPHNDDYIELHIGRVEKGFFTTHVFESMQENDVLKIEGPLGDFYLREESVRPILFVAGGTGFAPIKGIIEHALQEKIARPMHLYWGSQSAKGLYLEDRALAWHEAGQLVYNAVLVNASENYRSGTLLQAVVADHPDLSQFDVYVSGAPEMVSAAQLLFGQHGLPKQHLFSDSFEFSADR